MKAEYAELLKQADRLNYRLQDTVDDPSAGSMQSLKNHMKQIVEDIKSDKQPRSLDQRIQDVQRELREVRHAGDTMIDFVDVDVLLSGYEDLRKSVRRLPNY